MVFHSLVFLSRISIFYVQYAFYDDNMSLIITISQFSTRWVNVENLEVLRFLLKKLWNEWECLTSVRTVLIICQKNRSYSFLDYQYFLIAIIRENITSELKARMNFVKGSSDSSHLFLKSMSERGGSVIERL